ncbi:MAG: hypothetical protein EP338_13605 [Bacteroidetes bacterium]|nr:MAG: hypothetical protein EP338_13605 [Bacteroidota bacterium]
MKKMKRTALLLAITFTTIGISCGIAQETPYRWKNGKKENLTVLPTQRYVSLTKVHSESELIDLLKIEDLEVSFFRKKDLILRAKEKSEVDESYAIIQSEKLKDLDLDQFPFINYHMPLYTDGNPENIIAYSELFHIKLKNAGNVDKLNKIAAKENFQIIGQHKYQPLWYTVAANKNSSGNSLELANLLHENKYFNYVQIYSFTEVPRTLCPTDQWALSQTTDVDINACEAWAITKGSSSVSIAVIDEGFDSGHTDLPNRTAFSYDVVTSSSPHQDIYACTPFNNYKGRNHATQVSGIIGGAHANSYGSDGVAPDCPLMYVSMDFTQGGSTWNCPPSDWVNRMEIAIIEIGLNQGASVINASWGFGLNVQVLSDAFENVSENGRNGLGCIVVASAGNSGGAPVDWPANLNHVIAVGAIKSSGDRWTNSAYLGTGVSVVAPGDNVKTTATDGISAYPYGSGKINATGTSISAPHVSAVAGLILSANPCLTNQEVTNIIESTTKKLSNYTYTSTAGKPNGTYNDETGYGLLDAHAAVLAAQNFTLNIDYDCNTNEFSTDATSGFTYQWYLNGVAISGATATTYTPSTAGTYHVVRTHSSGCTNSSGDYILTENGISGTPRIICVGTCQRIGPTSPTKNNTTNTYQWYVNTSGFCNNYVALSGETNTAICINYSDRPGLGVYVYKRVVKSGATIISETYYPVEFRNTCKGLIVYTAACCIPGKFDPSVSYTSGTPPLLNSIKGNEENPCGVIASISPNPGDGKLQVHTESKSSEQDRIQIRNYQGILIDEKPISKRGTTEFDISSQPNGLYRVMIICEEGIHSINYDKNH